MWNICERIKSRTNNLLFIFYNYYKVLFINLKLIDLLKWNLLLIYSWIRTLMKYHTWEVSVIFTISFVYLSTDTRSQFFVTFQQLASIPHIVHWKHFLVYEILTWILLHRELKLSNLRNSSVLYYCTPCCYS